MSLSPTVLPVAVTDALSKSIAAATSPEEIRAAVLNEAERQLAEKSTTEQADADKKKKEAEDAAAAAAQQSQTFKRTVSIGGKDFPFEDETEAGLERQIANAWSVAYASRSEAPAPKVETPAVPAGPTEEEKIAASQELELKFKRGEITAAQYIEQSGAVDDYLAKKGIPVETLKQTVEQSQTAKFENSWMQATEAFLHSPAGADWPGGEQNKKIIGLKIAELGLSEAEDKVAALAQAYESMKRDGLVFAAVSATKTPATDATKQPTPAAAAPAAPAGGTPAAPAAKTPAAPATPAASSLFGASSGVGATSEVQKAADGTTYQIPAEATPQEIIDAWKKEQIRLGHDPNAEFTNSFSTRR